MSHCPPFLLEGAVCLFFWRGGGGGVADTYIIRLADAYAYIFERKGGTQSQL